MISFVNFARMASIRVVFYLGTLHGYFFHQDFWPYLDFPFEYQIKRVLNSNLLQSVYRPFGLYCRIWVAGMGR